MKARTEKSTITRYSMVTITHWALAVIRIPRATIQVTKASRAKATSAISALLVATPVVIQPNWPGPRSASNTDPAKRGAEMQKMTLQASCTQPVNQPMWGLTVRAIQLYDAPQLGSRRFR